MGTPEAAGRARLPGLALLVVAGGGLLAAALAGRGPLVAVVAAAQLVLALGWLTALSATRGSAVVVLGTAVAADVVLVRRSTDRLGALAAVLGLALVAAILHQVLRRERPRATAGLAAAVGGSVAVGLLAGLLAVRAQPTGREVVAAALIAVVAAVVVRRPLVLVLRPGADRAVDGRALGAALVGLAAGAGAAAGYGAAGSLSATHGAAVGAAAALAAVLTDVVVTAPPEPSDPSRTVRTGAFHAFAPLGAGLLPLAAAVPLAYLVGRLFLT